MKLICPECKNVLNFDNDKFLCLSGHQFPINDKVCNLLPKTISDLTVADARYHEKQKDQWVDQHQLNSLRSLYFHDRIMNYLAKNSDGRTNILELSGGVGFDLELFLKKQPVFNCYVFSEISMGLLSYVRQKSLDDRISFFCLDAQALPFYNNQFEFICLIGAAHHFQNFKYAFEEIIRATKPNGTIILGIEPNTWFIRLTNKLKGLLGQSRLFDKNGSPADQIATGMKIRDYRTLARLYNLEIIRLEPVWFLVGFLHYSLELIYRVCRLKKRITLPNLVEQIFIQADNCLASLPVFRNLFFNYTVIFKKTFNVEAK